MRQIKSGYGSAVIAGLVPQSRLLIRKNFYNTQSADTLRAAGLGNLNLIKNKAAETPDTDLRGWHHAFTLIELLGAVLVISILSAIALPQYQAAVDKTKVMGALQLARSVKMAEEAYYLANGTYATNQEELDLSFSNGTENRFVKNGWRFDLASEPDHGSMPFMLFLILRATIGATLFVSQGANKKIFSFRLKKNTI